MKLLLLVITGAFLANVLILCGLAWLGKQALGNTPIWSKIEARLLRPMGDDDEA